MVATDFTAGIVGLGQVGRQVEGLLIAAGDKDRGIIFLPSGEYYGSAHPSEEIIIHDPPLGYEKLGHINDCCDVAFICVPTPSEPNSGFLDTLLVRYYAQHLEVPLIIIRSTLNPGDTERWANELGKDICYSPAWGPGEGIRHLFADMRLDPFVILGGRKEARKAAMEIYKQLYPATVRFIECDSVTAEITKLCENAFLATKVTFFNDLYRVCQRVGADYDAAREILAADPRIGPSHTFFFGGWSSKCLDKDTLAYASAGDGEAVLVETVIDRNEEHREGMS